MSFLNQIVAGLTLVRAAIQSPDYVTGVSGWSIKRDGSAEFNDVAIRGGGSSDPLVVGPDGLPQVVVRTTPTNGLVLFPTNRVIEADAATLNSAVVDEGAADERAELQMTSPTVTGATDGVRLVLRSQPQDGSLPPSFSVQSRDGASTYLLVDETEVRVGFIRIDSEQSVATAPILTGYVDLDAFDRVVILASGEIQWGPGSGARDVRLYREAAGVLATDDTFRVYRAATTDNALSVRVAGDTTSRLFVNADGGHHWGPGGGAGSDVSLTRSAAGVLNVSGSLTTDNIRQGTAQTPAPGGVPAQTSVTVTFADPMNGTPAVVVTPNSTAANLNSSNIRWAITNRSSTGFTINCWRDSNSATNFEYVAVAP